MKEPPRPHRQVANCSLPASSAKTMKYIQRLHGCAEAFDLVRSDGILGYELAQRHHLGSRLGISVTN